MHYNLYERQKLKKNIPYKKILIICAVLLVAVAVYVFFIHGGSTPTPEAPKAA